MLGITSVFLALVGLTLGVPSSSVRGLTPAAQADLIVDLPGLNFTTNYQQFSGYLDAGNNTLLHYWFIESQSSPATAPLLLWLNGGPGCSSLDGLLNELGPFHIAEDGKTLYNNTYSWNTFASIVYLEAPACVGFSYNTKGDCSASDDSTSQHNYNALQHFFAKFPSYRSNEFFVTGESYGGIYVPTLTKRIVENNASFPLNLRGFAVGNGLSSDAMNDDSIIFFANYHGLLGQILWDQLVRHCCTSDIPSQDTCHFSNSPWPMCSSKVSEASNIIYNGGLNMYNLYADCLPPSVGSQQHGFSRYHADRLNVFRSKMTTGLGINGLMGLDPPCTNSRAMSTYLNSAAVKKALHIHDSLPEWSVCSDEVNANFQRQYSNMSPQYKMLQQAGVRALVYNGDVDMACNFIGDQWFVESLDFKETAARRPWKSGGQVGGFVKGFELLDLMTVRGSGHMVPQDKPQPSLDMIKSFVMNVPYPS